MLIFCIPVYGEFLEETRNRKSDFDCGSGLSDMIGKEHGNILYSLTYEGDGKIELLSPEGQSDGVYVLTPIPHEEVYKLHDLEKRISGNPFAQTVHFRLSHLFHRQRQEPKIFTIIPFIMKRNGKEVGSVHLTVHGREISWERADIREGEFPDEVPERWIHPKLEARVFRTIIEKINNGETEGVLLQKADSPERIELVRNMGMFEVPEKLLTPFVQYSGAEVYSYPALSGRDRGMEDQPSAPLAPASSMPRNIPLVGIH